MAAASSTVWWIADSAQIALTAALDASGGPAELMVQGLMILTKPALGFLYVPSKLVCSVWRMSFTFVPVATRHWRISPEKRNSPATQ